jgi:hypothetical protein
MTLPVYQHSDASSSSRFFSRAGEFRLLEQISDCVVHHLAINNCGRPYACNFALVYTGVIVFGPVNILHGPESRDKKAWFLDQLLAKHG